MKKQIISLLLTMVMIFSLIPLASFATVAAVPTVDTDWYDTETADSHPNDLYIYNEDDFAAFGKKINSESATTATDYFTGKVVHIMADLDMSEYSAWYTNGPKRGRFFDGIIDGHGHTISGLKLPVSTANTNNTLSGLLAGCIIPGTENTTYGCNAGVFNLTIVDSEISTGSNYCGGLFGSIGVGGTNNYCTGTVVFKNLDLDIDISSTADYVGGIIGESRMDDVEFENCIVRGDIDGTTRIGGYIGYNYGQRTTFTNCTSQVNINGTTSLGGFVGTTSQNGGSKVNKLWFDDCLYSGKIYSTTTTETNSVYLGGFVGCAGSYKSETEGRPAQLEMDNIAFYGTIECDGWANQSGAIIGALPKYSTSTASVSNAIVGGHVKTGVNADGESSSYLKRTAGIVYAGCTFTINKVIAFTTAIYVDSNQQEQELTKLTGTSGWYGKANVDDIAPTTSATGHKTTTAAEMLGTDVNSTYVPTGFTTMPGAYPLPVGVVNHAWEDNHVSADTATDGFKTAFRGFQTKVEGMVYKLRLVGLVNDMNGDGTLDDEYKAVGFDIVLLSHTAADGSQWTSSEPITTVYTSVKAKLDENSDEETSLSAAELGGDNIFVATVGAVPVNVGEVTFIVKTFHDTADGRVYDDVFTVTYDTAVATNS